MTVSALEQAKVELPNGETLNYRMKKGGKEVLLSTFGPRGKSPPTHGLQWQVWLNLVPGYPKGKNQQVSLVRKKKLSQ